MDITPPQSNVDVLIIGAGPSGLMCANALGKAGVNARIIDKRLVKIAAGQADGIQPRTIEVLQSYGLADRLLQEGNQMHMAAFYNPGKDGGIELTARAPDVTAPTARYPFEVTLHQGAIESIFLDSMRTYGVKVERPIVPTRMELSSNPSELLDPQAYPVKVTVQHSDDSHPERQAEVIHAKFVVGADGAHSWVRKTFGIEMQGEQTDYVWGVVDFTPDTDFPDIRNRCVIHSDSGSCMVIPREGDKVRLYIQLADPKVKENLTLDGRVDRSKIGPLDILEAARRALHPYRIETPEKFDWWTLYIIGQRVASKYSVHERVLIAGDACHTHSPKAGQGMNASMNDTHNIAWKLAYVLRGWADVSLLQTYEFERRQYAQDLISFDKKFSTLFSGKPKSELNLDGVSHDDFMQAFQTFGGFTSGIGVHYAASPIVASHSKHQHFASRLIIGERMPPQTVLRTADSRPVELQDLLVSDTKLKLLLFLGDLSNEDQFAVVETFARELTIVLESFAGNEWKEMFEIVTISIGRKSDLKFTGVPAMLRSHWTKVFIDDCDVTETKGGHAYDAYGVDVQGAAVVVRPDGYIGCVASLESAEPVDQYLSDFLRKRS
ncbi:FAD binding domain-containing protein [Pterulicium gracile]|uniref:FAD binding domain-containing protein n=1 Tax=Pterulicium gracile TaxID=1884261 RepID=A0A5C3QKJ7_9AGAR|nr:FAD binding domain-containing protein [Pterula gracilis]